MHQRNYSDCLERWINNFVCRNSLPEHLCTFLFTQIEEVNEQIRKEREEADARLRQATKSSEKSTGGGGSGSKNWSEDDLQLLIKAVNLFPAGTNSRYIYIAINSMCTRV